jgi:hypothetical protein
MDAIPSVGPFVGEAPEDRHAERVVGEMLTCLDDFAATVQPRLEAAMGAHIPGSVKGRERFLARLKAVPSPAIINVAGAVGKRCRFQVLLSLWKRDEFGGANVISCTAFADGPGTEKRDSFVRWRISRHALVRLVQELCWTLGDGVNQAADLSWLATSIPSRNVTPRTSFGN